MGLAIMLCKVEKKEDGTLDIEPHAKESVEIVTSTYLHDIDDFIGGLQSSLWPLNQYIHDNPELAFEEHKTHDALTNYMQSHEDWQITTSAYGIKTAWIAAYDSGKAGPVVSFNAEMGMFP
jgi:hypothetical protein